MRKGSRLEASCEPSGRTRADVRTEARNPIVEIRNKSESCQTRARDNSRSRVAVSRVAGLGPSPELGEPFGGCGWEWDVLIYLGRYGSQFEISLAALRLPF